MSRIAKIIMVILLMPISAKGADQQAQTVASLEAYLNNITTLVADFMQIAPDGSESTGSLFIARPGKLRWDYNPPMPVLIVVNGSLITHVDRDLDQISHASASDNLAGFLVRDKIKLSSGDIVIKSLKKQLGNIRLTIFKRGQEQETAVTLVFNQVPLFLKKLELQDSAGQITVISLSNIKQGMQLDKKLFIVKDPSVIDN